MNARHRNTPAIHVKPNVLSVLPLPTGCNPHLSINLVPTLRRVLEYAPLKSGRIRVKLRNADNRVIPKPGGPAASGRTSLHANETARSALACRVLTDAEHKGSSRVRGGGPAASGHTSRTQFCQAGWSRLAVSGRNSLHAVHARSSSALACSSRTLHPPSCTSCGGRSASCVLSGRVVLSRAVVSGRTSLHARSSSARACSSRRLHSSPRTSCFVSPGPAISCGYLRGDFVLS